MRLRYVVPAIFPAADGLRRSFTPVDVYMAKTPECRDWQEGSRYNLPRGVSISTTPQVTLPMAAPSSPLCIWCRVASAPCS
jgi:hypothetical protein